MKFIKLKFLAIQYAFVQEFVLHRLAFVPKFEVGLRAQSISKVDLEFLIFFKELFTEIKLSKRLACHFTIVENI
jgi:hypothetical protein